MTTTPITRRQLVTGAAATSVALATAACAGTPVRAHGAAPVRPARLREGDLVALVAPAKVTYDREVLRIGVESLEALGLRVTVGEHVMSRNVGKSVWSSHPAGRVSRRRNPTSDSTPGAAPCRITLR